MSRYASQTEVAADRSRAEIERTLQRYGAAGFMYGWEGTRAMVAFELSGRRIRFELPLPDRNAAEFRRTPTGKPRAPAAAEKEWEQATRQRWRALALCIKAKLEAVESEIATFDEEFLAYVVLPDGSTVGRHVLPKVEAAYLSGEMPRRLLPAAPGVEDE